MYRVLLAVDEDEQHAVDMANAATELPDTSQSVEATVLHVFQNVEAPPAAAVQEPPRRESPESNDTGDRNRFPTSVERVCDVFDTAGISYTVRGETGSPDEEILAVADELSVDAIYIGGKNRSPTGKVLFGSVTQDVLFNTELPVTIIGAIES
ncbi:universal stress protein [Natribaculum luteum]|uniref:Universal stress protein n=1 Tax=Natribaculum luteum TaxID=1586232 RepID=A0ABD5P257_9EURY|nr:universal stress protein [Natribaculum luteum]